MTKDSRGILAALAAALCFGATPFIAKAAFAGGASVLSLLSVRYLLASALLVPFACFREKKGWVKPRLLLQIMLVAGIFLGLEAGLYFYSLTLIPSSVAVMILFTFPLIVNVVGHFLGRKISIIGWGAILTCLGGLAVLLGADFGSLKIMGILCAFLAAISYSVYLLLIDRLVTGISPAVTNAIVSVSNALTMSVAALATGTFSLLFQPSAYFAILMMVILANVVGFNLFFWSMKRIGPDKISMINMTEPMFTVLLGVLLLNETLSFVQISGATLMIVSLFLFVMKREISRTHAAQA